MEPCTPIEIGLTTAIVAVKDDEPRVLVAEGEQKDESAPAFPPVRSIRSRTARWKWACAPGWRRRPRSTSAMSSSSTHSAIAAAMRAPAIPIRMSCRSAISRSPACPTTAAPLRAARLRALVPFLSVGRLARGRPEILDDKILPPLEQWARAAGATTHSRAERLRLCFGVEGIAWDEEKVLERYELLYEAGLVEEAWRDGRVAKAPRARSANPCASITGAFLRPPSRGCAPS